MTLPEPKQLDFFDLRLDEPDQTAPRPQPTEPGRVDATPTPALFVEPEPSSQEPGEPK